MNHHQWSTESQQPLLLTCISEDTDSGKAADEIVDIDDDTREAERGKWTELSRAAMQDSEGMNGCVEDESKITLYLHDESDMEHALVKEKREMMAQKQWSTISGSLAHEFDESNKLDRVECLMAESSDDREKGLSAGPEQEDSKTVNLNKISDITCASDYFSFPEDARPNFKDIREELILKSLKRRKPSQKCHDSTVDFKSIDEELIPKSPKKMIPSQCRDDAFDLIDVGKELTPKSPKRRKPSQCRDGAADAEDDGFDVVDGPSLHGVRWSTQDDVKHYESVRTMMYPHSHNSLVSLDFPYVRGAIDHDGFDQSVSSEGSDEDNSRNGILKHGSDGTTINNKIYLDSNDLDVDDTSAPSNSDNALISIGSTLREIRDANFFHDAKFRFRSEKSLSWGGALTAKEICSGRLSLPDLSEKYLSENDEDDVELDAETKWIRNHIKCRVCSQFIPAPESNSKSNLTLESMLESTEQDDGRRRLCKCGNIFKDHLKSVQSHFETNKVVELGTEWDYRLHSRQMTTNAFGEVEFVGFGGNIGKYIRVDIDTKMNDMLELMMKVWGMDKPNLLISVTGGAKNFKMSKRLKETFRRGLMKTALTTGAWIITGGTHAGVMKHVGEAVKDFGVASSSSTQGQVVTIGIASWGCIQNRHVLENSEMLGCWPAPYRIEKEEQPKQSFLDPNHSHFIFCDNGTSRKFTVEIPFRARLENKIAQMRTDTGENAVSVPIVLLVLEGGPGTLETVHQAIQNNTPAVIVQGSGRAADILAYAYQNSKEDEIEALDHEGKRSKRTIRYMEDALEVEVIKMVEREFGPNNTATHMSRIKDCLNKGDFMSVFELDSTSGTKEIDVAMLQALLKANKNQVMDQLRLALAWNRIDVAKSDIFTDDKRWPTGSLDDVMLSAIQLNRVDFVELFLDHGVSLREFLTKKRMLTLYNKIPRNCLLRTMLTKVKKRIDPVRRNFSLLDVGILMQDLLGDYFRSHYILEEYANLDVDNILEGLTIKQAQKGALKGLHSITAVAVGGAFASTGPTTGAGVQQQYDFENPTQELFIWSVLMIRQEMAKLFWVEGKDAIAAALVSNGLLRAMKKQTDDTELVNKIQDGVCEWSNLAVGVLNECHSMDEHKAQYLLIRELTYWGDATCMLIAVKADNKEFIAQTPCQSLLNSIWMGKMQNDVGTSAMLLCVICPFLVPCLLRFQSDSEKTAAAIKFNPEAEQLQESTQTPKTVTKRPTDPKGLFKRQATFKKQKTSPALNIHGSRTSVNIPEEDEEKDWMEEIVVPKAMYGVGEKLYYFFNAPVIIFIYNVISYLAFLLLFSYVLIVEFNFYFSRTEVILIIWVVSILMEEVRQIVSGLMDSSGSKVATSASSTMTAKLQSYIFDTWNVVDLITIGLFILAMILRTIDSETTYEASRVFLALNFVTFVVRLLHIFSVRKELGPKLVMIGRMVQDLMYFVLILMVFIVAYAVASYAILFPNAELTWDTVIAVIRRPYWNIYGELFLEDLEGDNNCSSDPAVWSDGDTPRCPTAVGQYVVPIMMGMYMLLANVLLLNLLIAMFSYTFQKVQDNTDKHWTYQRYSLIYEYYTRPVLCPPFIIFAHVYLFFKYLCGKCCCKNKTDNTGDDFRRKFRNERELVQWENVIADAFHHKTKMKATDSVEHKVNATHKRLDILMNRIDDIQDHQHQITTSGQHQQQTASAANVTTVTADKVNIKMPPQLDQRLSSVEEKLHNAFRSLEWIIQNLKEDKATREKDKRETLALLEKHTKGGKDDMGADDAKRDADNGKRTGGVSYVDLEEMDERRKKTKEEMVLERRQMMDEMMDKSVEIHFRSRQTPYLGTELSRFPVPDSKVLWNVPFQDYHPVSYTSPEILSQPDYADPDLIQMSPAERMKTISDFNNVDSVYNCNRRSFLGIYAIQNGLPLNIMGRTGIVGRGQLGRWGPNHAGDPIVTRWKMKDGQRVMKHKKPVFEVVAVMRSDNKMWALPGAILPPGAQPVDHLQAEFSDEALGNFAKASDAKSKKKELKRLWKHGVLIYEGYADDPRNTDNAWLESTVFSYHDDNGTILNHFNLRAGNNVEYATWLTASSKLILHGSHLFFLKKAAEKLDAHF